MIKGKIYRCTNGVFLDGSTHGVFVCTVKNGGYLFDVDNGCRCWMHGSSEFELASKMIQKGNWYAWKRAGKMYVGIYCGMYYKENQYLFDVDGEGIIPVHNATRFTPSSEPARLTVGTKYRWDCFCARFIGYKRGHAVMEFSDGTEMNMLDTNRIYEHDGITYGELKGGVFFKFRGSCLVNIKAGLTCINVDTGMLSTPSDTEYVVPEVSHELTVDFGGSDEIT